MYSSVCLFLFLHFCELNVFINYIRCTAKNLYSWKESPIKTDVISTYDIFPKYEYYGNTLKV